MNNDTNEQRIPTTQKLADALQKARAPQWMIDRAKAGVYDDYKSDSVAPINLLVAEATNEGLESIAVRAMNGDFDGQDWEAEEWAASQEGQATLEELGLNL